jgi:hypothetical protein
MANDLTDESLRRCDSANFQWTEMDRTEGTPGGSPERRSDGVQSSSVGASRRRIEDIIGRFNP